MVILRLTHGYSHLSPAIAWGVGGGGGRGKKEKRKHAAASSRTIYRRDIEPEIRAARILGVPCELVIVNMRNGAKARSTITDAFERVATPSSLNE